MSGHHMSGDIKVALTEGVMSIAFARASKKNALTAQMYEAILAALEAAAGDDAIGAVLFCGEGGVFTSGNDIGDFLAASRNADGFRALDFIRAVAGFEKPIVCAVDGMAIGVGTTMLFHCDLVYASPTAKFRMPFIDLALVPEAASSLLVPQRVGLAKASEWLLLGEGFDAQEALRTGVINAILPTDELLSHARSKAQALAQKPRGALMASRRLLRGERDGILARIDIEAKEFGARMVSDEARRVFAAFMNKQKP